MNQRPPFRPSTPPPAATESSWIGEPSGPGDDVLTQILIEMKQSRKLLEQIAASISKQAVVVEVTESQEPAVHVGERVIPGQDVQAQMLVELKGVHKLLEDVTGSGNAMLVKSVAEL